MSDTAEDSEAGKIVRPPSKEELLFALIIGEAKDVIEQQRANIEVQTELLAATDAMREAIQVHAKDLKATVSTANVELVAHDRALDKMLRDFRTNAGEELTAPILAAVARVVRRELNRTVLIAGGSATVGVVVGLVLGGIIAKFF